jgi:hypothetical protein
MSISATLDLSGAADFRRRLGSVSARIGNPGSVMVSWMKILAEGNRKGVLAGTGGDGRALVPVTYRPVGRARATTATQRNLPAGRHRPVFAGFGPHAAGLNNNLTAAEYRQLGGPPLAPRKANSRVVTNYMVDYDRIRDDVWQATYWWRDVVNIKGIPFLRYHFDGTARLPKRDLRGIRPEDRALMARAQASWMKDVLRNS